MFNDIVVSRLSKIYFFRRSAACSGRNSLVSLLDAFAICPAVCACVCQRMLSPSTVCVCALFLSLLWCDDDNTTMCVRQLMLLCYLSTLFCECMRVCQCLCQRMLAISTVCECFLSCRVFGVTMTIRRPCGVYLCVNGCYLSPLLSQLCCVCFGCDDGLALTL